MLVWCVLSCGRSWSVCEVVLVRYVDAVGAVTVMRVLLFVCILRECGCARMSTILVLGTGDVLLNAGHEYEMVHVLCLSQLTC